MEKYIFFLRPHANARYEQEQVRLAAREAQALIGRDIAIDDVQETYGVPSLAFEAEEGEAARLSTHSLMYLLMKKQGDGSLLPAARQDAPYLGSDLPAILKYSGKTNESFTAMMINMALTATPFDGKNKLSLYDPMCGKATTLFLALNRHWYACGSDTDRKALQEAETYFKKYLEYHKYVHTSESQSLTIPKKPAARSTRFDVTRTREEQKSGDIISLQTVCLDARDAGEAFGKERFHLIVTDMPYGVQHAPHGESLKTLLRQAVPGWYRVLKKGGACAVSFNVNTLSRQDAEECLESAGLTIMRDQPYNDLEHWVEQAITRDVVIGVKN